jgi:adenine-specific DNA-methyltransferase
MQNLLNELKDLLQQDERLVVEGKLLKNKIIELSLQLDPSLLKMLISQPSIKKHFFQEVEKVLVFDKIKFQKFVSNKAFLPDCYTSYKNKIGLIGDDEFILETKDVVLSWPFKDCILEGGQTKDDQKRTEVFWNETLAPDEIDRLLQPKVFSNIQMFDSNGATKKLQLDQNSNIIIKGNNLITLHSLIKRYANKIRFIYIDPPYNTGGAGNTFAYNNTFNHSTWLTFMKNRLEIAKQFLTEDGFIAIAIDHFELYYLGVLADEIFGRENKIGVVTVVHKPEGRNQEKFFATSNEFMLVYAKNKELANFTSVIFDEEKKKEYNLFDNKGRYKLANYIRLGGGDDNLKKNKPHFFYPIYVHPKTLQITVEELNGYLKILPITNKGQERTWKTKRETFIERLNQGDIEASFDDKKNIVVNEKYREDKGQLIKTHWIDKRYNAISNGTNLLEEVIGSREFSYPKSLFLVQDIINICTQKDSIVLDFFGGSGTTAHAVLNLNKEDNGNRKFIICEQMDYIENVTKERIKKIIHKDKIGSFIYLELAKYNQIVADKIINATTDNELEKIYKEISNISFISYKTSGEVINNNASDFTKLNSETKKKVLIEILDKNQLYIPYTEINDKDYSITEEDKSFNDSFYKNINLK